RCMSCCLCTVFFVTVPAPPACYTLSLHDALPILRGCLGALRLWPDLTWADGAASARRGLASGAAGEPCSAGVGRGHAAMRSPRQDRKSTRLNSSHVKISYAVFCLKKKTKKHTELA